MTNRATDLVRRLEKVDEDLKRLKDRSDEASIRRMHLTGISEHLQTQLLEELDWADGQTPEHKIKRKKKLRR